MIVTVASLEDFILRLSKATDILEDAVSTDIVRKPIGEVSYEILFQASAVVRVNETAEYLLQFGIKCGVDYEDQGAEHAGSHVAQVMREVLKEAVEKLGYVLLPGMISGM